ncbi:MAG: MarR family transcriptional regulator [Hyphomicrobium sp.]|nr:MAG: MarR family transcriptional regulator [Hyphomicrobium sp.]
MPRGTKADADLDLLTAVERGEIVTQQMLKHELGVSVGLINALIKRAVKKGLVKVRQAPYKRYAYYLTPRGFAEKGRLVADYLEYSLTLFRESRDQYSEIFRDLRRRDKASRIVLVGGGDLAEIAVLAAVGEEIALLGIVDPGSNVQTRYGVRVGSNLAAFGDAEVAVITDLISPQATFEALRKNFPDGYVFAPEILRITPDRAELLASSQDGGEP